MNTINSACTFSARAARRLALGAGDALGVMVPVGFRRLLAATASVAALAVGSLAMAQPAAADTTYPVNVTFDKVTFTMVNDGCANYWPTFCTGDADGSLELYGTVGAYTTAGAVSAGGLPYRNIGKWGEHPCEAPWAAGYGTTCTKEVTLGSWDFTQVFLCKGSSYTACSTGYGKPNNTIPLQVRPGEQFKVTVLMQDYDALSSNDTVCQNHMWFGPYTATELAAKKFVTDAQGKVLSMGYNGHAECWVYFHLS
jgi:hypothetical protein